MRPARIRSRSRPASWRTRWPGPGSGDLAAKAVDDELTLRLPSVTDGPLASPELVRPPAEAAAETPAAARRVALAAWRVPVLVFEPPAATALLPALADLAGWRRRPASSAVSATGRPPTRQ